MAGRAHPDFAVVGAGIVGLAVARELLARHPGAGLVVLEREQRTAAHQSGANSGVIHAGIYYEPGSLRARLCVEGARDLYAYCDEHGIPAQRSGKLVVALGEDELPRLSELERRGRANGVPGLERLDVAGLRAVEPHAAGIAALHSPETGTVDFAAVAGALRADVEAAGGEVRLGAPVERIEPGRVVLSDGDLECGYAVACAGAWSDRLAVSAGAPAEPRIVPFRGAYLRVARPERVRSMIYPVPDPALPFLGVHLTRHGGELLLGPTALIAGARDAGRLLRPRDALGTLAFPGTRRLALRHRRAALRELRFAVSRRALAAEASRYVPGIEASDLAPAFAGVRAQALGRDGRLLDDFLVSETERALHVRNAPSPAATSCLALARLVADRAEAALSRA
ncbi:MAG TPA: L-2-hydroxyglutarate oxidase [Thermoleophilaceae bacterium]|nr:L-2-hydroxyglutarate oxidase [Thermoleophilaceae bacterium]